MSIKLFTLGYQYDNYCTWGSLDSYLCLDISRGTSVGGKVRYFIHQDSYKQQTLKYVRYVLFCCGRFKIWFDLDLNIPHIEKYVWRVCQRMAG